MTENARVTVITRIEVFVSNKRHSSFTRHFIQKTIHFLDLNFRETMLSVKRETMRVFQ